MKNEPKFGAALSKDQWIQRTVTTDPAPRMPFSNGPAGSPNTMPSMSRTERFLYSVAWGFAIGVLLMVSQ